MVTAKPKKKGTFQKGHRLSVGNKSKRDVPRKRHEERFLLSALQHALSKKLRDRDGNVSTYAERIMTRFVKIAATGKASDSVKAIMGILDRVEGKPNQSIELKGNAQAPVQMITKEMSDAEAARIVQSMLRKSQGEEE